MNKMIDRVQRLRDLENGIIARDHHIADLKDKIEEEHTQSEARIEELKNHIGEMGSMLKFNEMTARIRELEDIVGKIRGHVEFLEKGVDAIGGDIYKQQFYLSIKQILSERSDKEDAE